MKKKILSLILSSTFILSNVSFTNAIEPIPSVIMGDINGHWAEESIKRFVSHGYIDGYSDGTFRPNNRVTRAEFVKIFNNYFNLKNSSGKEFVDTRNHWAKREIDIAVTNKITNGVSKYEFAPNKYITREQAATMVANYLEIHDNNYEEIQVLEDYSQISPWARSGVEGIIEQGYVVGKKGSRFKPKHDITRAELVSLLDQIK